MSVKWHRVPVLSHRWWISVHHAGQAVIIQLTSKSSPSGIAQAMFWDIWNRTESVVMKPSTVNCAMDLVRGPQASSYRYYLPLRPSSNVVPLLCGAKLQFSTTVARQEIFVVPDSNQIQSFLKPRN